MADATCEVKDGAGAYQATTTGVDVTPGNTVTVRLVSQAGVNAWLLECASTDELGDKDAVNASLVIDSVQKTATLPAPVEGRAHRMLSSVVDLNGRITRTSFGIYTRKNSRRVHALDETTESGPFGWGKDWNELVRDAVEMPDSLAAGDLLYINGSGDVARLPIGSNGQVLSVVSGLPSWGAGGSVPSAPTAILPTSGSTAGGTVVQITVSSSAGLTGAKVGGVALTSFSIVNGTTVQGTTGAHAAGAVDVVVSNAFGDSAALAAGFTYSSAFDAATLAATAFWRDYANVSPHVGTASAGTSGSNDLVEVGGSKPAAGTALNGHGVDDYNGSTHHMVGDDTAATYLDVDGYGGWALINVDAISTNFTASNTQIQNVAIFGTGGGGGYFQVYLRSTGGSHFVGLAHYDTGTYKVAEAPITLGGWVMIHFRYTGGATDELQVGTNGTWGTATTGVVDMDAAGLALTLTVGKSSSGAYFDGKMADRQLFDFAPSNTDINNAKSYVNARYALSL